MLQLEPRQVYIPDSIPWKNGTSVISHSPTFILYPPWFIIFWSLGGPVNEGVPADCMLIIFWLGSVDSTVNGLVILILFPESLTAIGASGTGLAEVCKSVDRMIKG